MTQIGVRRLATKALALYVTLGILTLLHWEFVWLKGVPDYPPFTRTSVTIVFGPTIAATWPAYWVTMYKLGPWAWLGDAAAPSRVGGYGL